MRTAAVTLMALLLFSGREAAAQEMVSITGQVLDALTRDPIPGVAVTFASRSPDDQPDLELETDSAGRFAVQSIAVGEYRLQLRHPLYNPSVGDFTVVRAGPFVTSMQPVALGDDELLTGIVGVLTDAATGDALSGVTVRTGQGQTGTFTDTRGEFLFDDLIAGQHVLEFSMIGYAARADTIRVTAGRVTNVEVSLSVDPVGLEPIVVSVERREARLQEVGFYHRRQVGFGEYIDRLDIENRGPLEVTDLFSGMPGVELFTHPTSSLGKFVVLRSGRLPWRSRTLTDEQIEERRERFKGLQPPEYNRCFPAVYIDDLLAHSGGADPARLDDLLAPAAIAGIEVYPSTAGLPAKYQAGGARCGVIVIWTRVRGVGSRKTGPG
ncbi:MAG: carboxypeptidase regulatory-like domain-containing protein [Gemmatimonadota bacterium]|nr:carboxypeptidase regulatory-like domain-containing protein [Gemmatimonadota bacterium]MDE2870664.1 carboxypeptidase regulatory-like domain-containing protein [Gemmatimonadota bacterium]